MKKNPFLLLLFVLLTGLTTACSDDDEVNVECPPKVQIDNVTGRTVCLINETLELRANLEKNPLETLFEWTIDGQPAGSGETFHFSSATAGIFDVALRASNRDGVDTDVITLQVNGENPPVITAFNGSTTCFPGESVTLTAALEDNALDTQYSWTYGDATLSTTPTCTFTSEEAGEYVLTFRATNADGIAIREVTVTVVNAFSTADILHWTGEGTNTSVLGIQWTMGDNIDVPTDEQIKYYAWGYRWDPATTPSGYDMLAAIAKNDPRLFIVVAQTPYGAFVQGFGYDGNGDGKFEVSNADGTFSLNQGHFVDGCYTPQGGERFDGLHSVSQYDYWMGGMNEAYASYWLGTDGANIPTTFDYAPVGASDRALTHQSWDTWTFSSINSSESNVDPRPALVKAAPANK